MQILNYIDLQKNEIRNAVVQNLSTPPVNPFLGQVYFDTILNLLQIWDGTHWISSAITTLSTLTDCHAASGALIGQTLVYSGTDWAPQSSANTSPRQTFTMFLDTSLLQTTAGVISETLLSMSTNVNGVTTTAQTSYTVPSSKTLRIQSFSSSISTTNFGVYTVTDLKFRATQSGGVVDVTSPQFFNTLMAVGANNSDHAFLEFPDGFEFLAGATIGIGQVSNNINTRFLSVNLVGFLY